MWQTQVRTRDLRGSTTAPNSRYRGTRDTKEECPGPRVPIATPVVLITLYYVGTGITGRLMWQTQVRTRDLRGSTTAPNSRYRRTRDTKEECPGPCVPIATPVVLITLYYVGTGITGRLMWERQVRTRDLRGISPAFCAKKSVFIAVTTQL